MEILHRITRECLFEADVGTTRGLVERATAEGADLRGANLRDANLWGANLIKKLHFTVGNSCISSLGSCTFYYIQGDAR